MISHLSKFDFNINLHKNIVKIILSNSLTQELSKNVLPFSVKLISVGEKKIYSDEEEYFSNTANKFYVREVDLLLGNLQVVRARSICDLYSNYWKEILNCGNNSLGYYLFNDKNKILRSKLNFFYMPKDYPLLKKVATEKVISRRSLFISAKSINPNNNKLLLTECFLDDLKRLYK